MEEEKRPILTIKSDKRDYFACSMYYMRRYFGLRETLLLAFLLVAALLLFFLADSIIILVFFGVTVFILLITVVLFLWTSVSGYKHDFDKQGIAAQKLYFDDDALRVEFYDKGGELLLTETHEYEKLEGVVTKKNFIYIYAAVAIFYYIKRAKTDPAEFAEIGAFLHEHVPEAKFKFKQVKRRYPKKKKVTFDGK